MVARSSRRPLPAGCGTVWGGCCPHPPSGDEQRGSDGINQT